MKQNIIKMVCIGLLTFSLAVVSMPDTARTDSLWNAIDGGSGNWSYSSNNVNSSFNYQPVGTLFSSSSFSSYNPSSYGSSFGFQSSARDFGLTGSNSFSLGTGFGSSSFGSFSPSSYGSNFGFQSSTRSFGLTGSNSFSLGTGFGSSSFGSFSPSSYGSSFGFQSSAFGFGIGDSVNRSSAMSFNTNFSYCPASYAYETFYTPSTCPDETGLEEPIEEPDETVPEEPTYSNPKFNVKVYSERVLFPAGSVIIARASESGNRLSSAVIKEHEDGYNIMPFMHISIDDSTTPECDGLMDSEVVEFYLLDEESGEEQLLLSNLEIDTTYRTGLLDRYNIELEKEDQ